MSQFVSVACVTVCDYFGDLRQFLDTFFFERVASMILIHIGMWGSKRFGNVLYFAPCPVS